MSDERGGRYFREARFFLAGDRVTAQSHTLDARKLMGYMRDMYALGGPAVMVKYSALPDGTTIKAVMQNGQYQAYIYTPTGSVEERETCPNYIESGALTLGYITPGDLSLVDSGVLHDVSVVLPDDIVGLMDASTDATEIYALPVPLVVLDEPDPSVCTLDVPDGSDTTFVDTACIQCKQFVSQCELCAKKMRADYFNPSRFTGKMRLFMQALLGSDPTRIVTEGVDSNKVVPPYVTGFVLDEGGAVISFTTLLIRDENWNYWLVDMQAWYASVIQLTFSDCADDILAELKNTPELDKVRETQLEAMLFTYASASGAPEDVHTVSHDHTPGAPITFGWHGAYRLAEAVRVAHTTVSATNGSGYVYKAYLQRATFVTTPFDPETDTEYQPPTIEIATEETVEWLGEYQLDWMYTPDYVSNVNVGSTFGAEFTGSVSSDAPVYAFYKTDDTTQLVRYVNYASTNVPYFYDDNSSPCGVSPTWVYSHATHNAGNRGFYITGASSTIKEAKSAHAFNDWDVTWISITYQWVAYGTYNGGTAVPYMNVGGACGAATPNPSQLLSTMVGSSTWPGTFSETTYGQSHRYNATRTYLRSNVSSTSISVNSFVLIPLNCPDAAYVGSATVDDEVGVYTTGTPGAGLDPRTRQDVFTGKFNATYQQYSNTVGPSLTYADIRRETMTTAWVVNFAHQTGTQQVASGTETKTRDNGGGTGPLPAWPSTGLPTGLQPWADFLGMNGSGLDLYGLHVEQSVNGLMRYQTQHSTAHVTNGDFPNTAYVFLGWA